MSNFKNIIFEIYRKHKSLLALMVVLFILGAIVLVYSVFTINPNVAVVKIGYGDIGGYRDGTWTNMLVFPVFAGIFGVLHNFLAVKIFEKYGDGIAKVFVVVSILLLVGMFIVLLRLLGEN